MAQLANPKTGINIEESTLKKTSVATKITEY